MRDVHVPRLILMTAAALLVAGYWAAGRWESRRARIVLDVALVLLVLPSVFLYFDCVRLRRPPGFINYHDLYHYYMGAKYSPEVGYFNLYDASVVASAELHGKPVHDRIRRMDNYRYTNAKAVLKEAAKYKQPFSPERWLAFKNDIQFFETAIGLNRWPSVVRDMGHNATPVWNMVGRALCHVVPVASRDGCRRLAAFDLILIVLMAGMVAAAFGWRTALFVVIYFCTCFWLSYTQIRGGWLRMDWLAFLVSAICLLKMGCYKTAGAALAYAGMARIFPLAFAFGLGAKCLWQFFKTRTLDRKYIGFFATFAAVCAVLILLSILDMGGLHEWAEFKRKIAIHNRHLSAARVGFRNIFLLAYKYPETGGWMAYRDASWKTLDDWKVLWWAIQAAVLLVSLAAVRRLDDYEAVACGYVPVFFLTAPTFYYHVMTVVVLIFFLPKLDRVSRMIGVELLFLTSIVLFAVNLRLPLDLPFSFAMAVSLGILVVYVTVAAFLAEESQVPSRWLSHGLLDKRRSY